MIDTLTKEIIKRILADVGAVPEFFGQRGLTHNSLLLDKNIKIAYDDKVRSHDVFSGKLLIGPENQQVTMRGLFVNLTVEKDIEYLFVFRVDDLPIHVVRMVYAPDEFDNDCYIRIQNLDKGTWFTPSTEMMAHMLAEFEKIVSHGLLWEDCNMTSDLFDVAVKLINKE